MKISKKIAVTLCIIVSILAISLYCVWWCNNNPYAIFSKYHSYVVDDFYGNFNDVPLTDEQFKRIVDVYKQDKLSRGGWLDDYQRNGVRIKLYETNDMSGDYVHMVTGTNGKGDGFKTMCLWIGDKCFPFDKSDTAEQVNAIIREAIEQSESEQKL